jgi:hypothetical protein
MKASCRHIASAFACSALVVAANQTIADVDFDCQAIEVLEKNTFTHVRCSNTQSIGGNDIRYIALPHTDPQKLKRFQDLATQAVSCGGLNFKARIADPATAIGGCNPIDCREAKRFGIRRQ